MSEETEPTGGIAGGLLEKGKDLLEIAREKGGEVVGHIVEEGKELFEKAKDMLDGDNEDTAEAKSATQDETEVPADEAESEETKS